MPVDSQDTRESHSTPPVAKQLAAAASHSSRGAVLQALFVTFLWSTSLVLIKIGLDDIPAVTFAGLRYSLAFLVLIPLALRPSLRAQWRGLPASTWWKLVALGLLMYTITQGSWFLALVYLPATTVALFLSFTPVLVALLGAVTIREIPSRVQWIGTAIYLVGAWVYLFPTELAGHSWIGFAIIMVGVASNAAAAVVGRAVQRDALISPIVVTIVSMGVGSLVLLGGGLALEGLPSLGLSSWLIVLWLAVINTAFAFTLWNATQRVLPALTSSLINNTMLVQIAVLAWIFLGESLGADEIAGLVLAVLGVLVSQVPWARALRRRRA